jgi:glycosyltransferase involved in cell wall biosynthesis
MKRILVVTTLDYRYYANNRVHHIVDHVQKRFEEVFLIFKKAYIPGECSFLYQIKGFLTLKTKRFRNHNVTSIEVDPILNHGTGLGLSILKLNNPYNVPSSYLKKFLRKTMSFMGFVTELALLPSFFIAYLVHVRSKFDIFIGQGPWEIAFGLILRKLGLVRMVVYDDFDYAPGNQPISKIRQQLISYLEKACLINSDLIISVGDLLGKLREEQTGRKVYVIPNGVNYPLFKLAQAKVPHPPTLIYMGFVYGWAGLELIFHSLVKIKEEFPEIRFLIIGHTIPSYIEWLMTLRDNLHLEKHIYYIGRKNYSELIPYLREADIGMALFKPIPLRKYAFPLKVIEYLAAGLPVITTKGLQAADIVDKGQCGKAVDFDAMVIADAIIGMLNDLEGYQRYSENAKNFSQSYDWNVVMQNDYNTIDRHYKEVLNGGR